MKLRAAYAAIAFAGAALAADHGQEILIDVAPSVYTVVADRADGTVLGSGVVVRSGAIATVLHVAGNATRLRVRHGEAESEATLIARDEAHDLALLSVAGLEAPAVTFGETGTLKTGASLYAIGAPLGLDLEPVKADVVALHAGAAGLLIQTSAAVTPGAAGGGLFSEERRLLGIAGTQAGAGAGLDLSAPVEALSALLAQPAQAAQVPAPPPASPPPAQAQVQTTPAAQPEAPAARPAEKIGKAPSLYVASAVIVLLIVFAIPATKWLANALSSDTLPDPPPPRLKTPVASGDGLMPFRDLVKAEMARGYKDSDTWELALKQNGNDQFRATAAYPELRTRVLHQKEMARRAGAAEDGARDRR